MILLCHCPGTSDVIEFSDASNCSGGNLEYWTKFSTESLGLLFTLHNNYPTGSFRIHSSGMLVIYVLIGILGGFLKS
jgi:hypothetical protein